MEKKQQISDIMTTKRGIEDIEKNEKNIKKNGILQGRQPRPTKKYQSRYQHHINNFQEKCLLISKIIVILRFKFSVLYTLMQ